MHKPISGKRIIKILCQKFNFSFISQKGSHVKLQKRDNNKKIITIVPVHKELAIGTLKGILSLAEINEKEFWQKI